MRKLLMLVGLLFALAPVQAQDGHEYAPLLEKSVNYQDWTLPGLADRKLVNLRTWAKDKKLVMVVYFAPWCGNWKFDAPVVTRLYEKYKAQGVGFVGVSKYASLDAVREFFGPAGPPFPIVTESETRDDKTVTAHFGYRKTTGDGRNWGSPWHIFLDPAKFPEKGNTLAENATIVNGELIEADADKFIAERLKPVMPAKTAAAHSAFSTPAKSGAVFSATPPKKPALELKTKDDKDKTVKPCPDN